MTDERNHKELMDRLYDAASKLLRSADTSGTRLVDFESDEFQIRKRKFPIAN